MEPLTCKACGAPLERDGHCAYCGARYKIEDGLQPIVYELENPRVRRIVAETRYNEFIAKEINDIGTIAMRNIAGDMAHKLTEAIKYTTCYDPMRMEVIVRGELRVVDPDFRF